MVSDAVGAKVLGQRSEGTLPSVPPIRCLENKAEICFTSRRIPMPSVWRTRNRSTSRDIQANLQRTDVRFNSTLQQLPWGGTYPDTQKPKEKHACGKARDPKTETTQILSKTQAENKKTRATRDRLYHLKWKQFSSTFYMFVSRRRGESTALGGGFIFSFLLPWSVSSTSWLSLYHLLSLETCSSFS